MKPKKIIALLIVLAFIPCLLFGQENEDRAITEIWREVLLFGIDSEVLTIIKSIKQAREQSLNEQLLELFEESANPQIRLAVLNYFRDSDYGGAVNSAATLLEDENLEDSELLVTLMGYLSRLEAVQSRDRIEYLVDSSEELVAEAAIGALSKIGDENSAQFLVERLENGEFSEKMKPRIIVALGDLEYQGAVEILMEIVQNGEQERTWRMYAAISLGKIGDKKAVSAIKSLFEEQDSLIKMYAASGLAYFDMKEVQDILIQGLRDSNVRVRIASAKALAHKEAKDAVDILIYKAKHDPENKMRMEAIVALGEIGTANAFVFLREEFQNKHSGFLYRETALDALCENDLPGSLGTIEEVIETEWPNKDTGVLEFVAKRLSRVESKSLKKTLARFLQSKNLYVRIYGLRGVELNRINDLRGQIEDMSTEDPHPAVRQVALSVLEKW